MLLPWIPASLRMSLRRVLRTTIRAAAAASAAGELGIRALVERLRAVAERYRAMLPFAVHLLALPLAVFSLGVVMAPGFSLHCRRTRLPQRDRCQLIEWRALVVPVHRQSFALVAVQQAQIVRLAVLNDPPLEQLVLTLRTPPSAAATAAAATVVAIGALDWRPKAPWQQRLDPFLVDREQDRLDLFLPPVLFRPFVATVLAVPLLAGCWRGCGRGCGR